MPEELLDVAKPKKRSRCVEFPIDPAHWRLSKGVLASTASTRAGLSQEELHRCIDEEAEFMKSSRAHLKLPQATIATAIVFFQRYVVSNVVRPADRRIVADACVFLAAKAEDSPKYPAKALDVVIKAMHKTQVHADDSILAFLHG